MTTAAPSLKKKDDLVAAINKMLEQAVNSTKGFTPDTIQGFYVAGESKRAETQQVATIREAKPSRPLGTVVAKKNEMPGRLSLRPEAVKDAEKLAELFETAAITGKRFQVKEWVG
jgi:hypothetical protein